MKLCIIAYKIESDKGSEGGTAYNICRELEQKLYKPVLITRKKYAEKIMHEEKLQGLEIIGVELPKFLRFFKKGNRFFSLYYYLWCFFTALKITKLHKKYAFDIVHILNFHTASFPHFITQGSYKVIWGPLTNHFSVPMTFFSFSKDGIKQAFKDVIKKINFMINPFIKSAIKRSDLILFGMNQVFYPYTNAVRKIKYLPQAASVFQTSLLPLKQTEFRILFVGRMTSLKQPKLAAEAIALAGKNIVFSDMPLKAVFIGNGPLQKQLEQKFQNSPDFQFFKQIEQPALQQHYQSAAVLICPSFEAQGMVVAEAMSQGVVPLCWDRFGAAYLTGEAAITVPYPRDYQAAINAFAEKIIQLALLYKTDYERFAQYRIASVEQSKSLDWNIKAERIMEFYHDCLV